MHIGRVVVVANKHQNYFPRIYNTSLYSLVVVVLVVDVANDYLITLDRNNMISLETYL